MAGDPAPETSVWANDFPGAIEKNNLRGRTTPTITNVESETSPKLLATHSICQRSQ